MIRQQGDGGLDLLAVQRDDELLDLLGARTPVDSDDELVRLLLAWRDEVDDGLPGTVPAQRMASPTAYDPVPVAAPPVQPAVDLLPPAADERPHRRRLTAAGTAAAIVLGGTLSLSGVAAAVTGDPLSPYRAVRNALSIGGDALPEQAADVAKLNKRLSRARAAVAHGDTAGAQAAVDELTALLASADLTDEQRAAIEHRLTALQTAISRADAAEAERGRSSDRATAAATPPERDGKAPAVDGDGKADGKVDGNDRGDDQGDGDADDASTPTDRSGDLPKMTTPSTKPTSQPTVKPTKAAPDKPDAADEGAPADTGDQDTSDTDGSAESGQSGAAVAVDGTGSVRGRSTDRR